jgi:DNA polymerase III sliding clamp (beta) subunit (PCNA family)
MKTKTDALSLQLKILNSICRRDHVTLDGTYTSVWAYDGRLVTTNGETTVFCKTTLTLPRPVNCAQFYDAVRAGRGEASVDARGDALRISTKAGETKIAFLDIERPRFPAPFDRRTPVSIGDGILGYVAGAMSSESARYVLTGVCIDGENRRVVASDGKRLHNLPIASGKKFDPIILPSDVVALIRMAEDTGARISAVALSGKPKETPERAQIDIGDFTIDCKLVQGAFPDYSAVYPRRFHWTVELGTDGLRKALKDSISFLRKSKESLFAVQFDRKDGRIQLIVRSLSEKAAGVSTYPLQTFRTSGDLDGLQWFTLNPEYLLEALWTARTTTIQGSVTDQPLLVDGAALIMPVKPQTGPEKAYMEEVAARYKKLPGKEIPVEPVTTRAPNGEAIAVASPDIARCVACGANMKAASSDLCEACAKNSKSAKVSDLGTPEFAKGPAMRYTLRPKRARDLQYDIHEAWNAK